MFEQTKHFGYHSSGAKIIHVHMWEFDSERIISIVSSPGRRESRGESFETRSRGGCRTSSLERDGLSYPGALGVGCLRGTFATLAKRTRGRRYALFVRRRTNHAFAVYVSTHRRNTSSHSRIDNSIRRPWKCFSAFQNR